MNKNNKKTKSTTPSVNKIGTTTSTTSNTKKSKSVENDEQIFHPQYTKTNELLATTTTNTVETDLTNVLDKVKKLDRTCEYEKCKLPTSLIYIDCTHCSQRYCIKHSLPEVHGCGTQVRQAERKKFLHPTSGPTAVGTRQQEQRKEMELNRARNRLTQKLQTMSNARRQQQPGRDK